MKREARELRMQQERRTRRLRAAAIVGSVAAVAALWIGVYASQLFEVRRVQVVGNRTLSAESVTKRAALPEGATLLRYGREAMERRLLEEPWIQSVTISPDFPSTLKIRVIERVPSAVLQAVGGLWSVDADGLVLGQTSLESSAAYVVIRDVPSLQPIVGQPTNSPPVLNALRVLQGVSAELRTQVRAVSAFSVAETTLITATGVEITVGEAVQLKEKSALALGIMEDLGTGVVFIDVRSIDHPISRGIGD